MTDDLDLDTYWLGRNQIGRQFDVLLLTRPLDEVITARLARLSERDTAWVAIDLSRARDPLLLRSGLGE